MNALRYTLRSLVHHRRTAFGAWLGMTLVAFVLAGALMVRGQARLRLSELATERIGKTDFVLSSGAFTFRTALGDELARKTGARIAKILAARGSVGRPETPGQTPARIIGVDGGFWAMSPSGETPPGATGLIVNCTLAGQLGLREGDEIVLRIEGGTGLPAEAAPSFGGREIVTIRLPVAGIAAARHFGRFNLTSQAFDEPLAILPLTELQTALQQQSRINMVLFRAAPQTQLTPPLLRNALGESWTPDDIGIVMRERDTFLELRSPRIFLPQPAGAALKAAFPPGRDIHGILTYFVTELAAGSAQTPYSTVCAAPATLIGQDLGTNGIALTAWLAKDLRATAGSCVSLRYLIPGPGRRLVERKADFIVRKIIPMESPLIDESLTPDFAGMQNVADCGEWKTEWPIDLTRIRKIDEAYWDAYRAAPKAFIDLQAGQNLWGSPFGNLTAIRLPAAPGLRYKVISAFRQGINPPQVGLRMVPVRRLARQAASQALDAGALFMGLSIFLIVSALIMAGIFWGLHIEQRAGEIGLFRATGFTFPRLAALFTGEIVLLAALGAISGSAAAVPYAGYLLDRLAGIWRSGEFAGARLETMLSSALIPVAAVALPVALIFALANIARLARRPPQLLLHNRAFERRNTRGVWLEWLVLGAVAILAATTAMAYAFLTDQVSAPRSLIAGLLVLAGGIILARPFIEAPFLKPYPTLSGLARANAARAVWRSLAVAGLIACGLFLVVVVTVNRPPDIRLEPAAYRRWTGGIDFIVDSSFPIPLSQLERGAAKVMHELPGARILACRMQEGDDASCLNPARPSTPRILGVPTDLLQASGAFRLMRGMDDLDLLRGWRLLDEPLADGAIPAAVDSTTLTWGLGLRIGDELPAIDERGKARKLRIIAVFADSILQGNVVVSASRFIELFPSNQGAQRLLTSAGRHGAESLRQQLATTFGRYGIVIIDSASRADELLQVERLYIDLFGILGTLGLLLGAAGTGLLLLRNIAERRREIAIMRAIGFTTGRIRWLLVREHFTLVLLGCAIGGAAAMVASASSLAFQPSPSSWLANTGLVVGGIVTTAWLALLAGTAWISRQPLLPALRDE